jgi:hypothetical protein
MRVYKELYKKTKNKGEGVIAMKVYSKPIIEKTAIDNINEPVFLLGSGDPWYDSDCYVTSVREIQGWEVGRSDFTVQVDSEHIAEQPGYEGPFGHHNHHQYCVFEFPNPIPTGVSVTIEGVNGVFNSSRTRVRVELDYHQNATDHIGNGAFKMEWTGLSAVNTASEDAMYSYFPCDFDCNDANYRYDEHGYVNNQGIWIQT